MISLHFPGVCFYCDDAEMGCVYIYVAHGGGVEYLTHFCSTSGLSRGV